jgi:pimeloyl-ACP methyl ester carboxylesterase
MDGESPTPAVAPTGAVFLSYASEDAQAATRIAKALMAAGIDVWFDQSQLRGGDAWDARIRQQIKSCELFLPVISRNTHARDEGYFRLEWKLAVDRSHLMSKMRPFLVPIVIDDTPNDDQVPDGFRAFQWTLLRNGETRPEFVERIVALLSPASRAAHRAEGQPDERVAARSAGDAAGTGITQNVRFSCSADGTRIAFATTGSGYPLVSAAHWLGHLEFDLKTPVWLPWIENLSSAYTLTRYDMRGCGLSDRSGDRFVLEDLVSDLEAVIDAAGLDRFALLGMSQGGAISIAYAVRHPERVSHLVLCGAFARGPLKRGPSMTDRVAIAAMEKLVKVGWGERNPVFRQMFTSLFFPQATAAQMKAFNQIQHEATSAEHAARIFHALTVLDASGYLQQLKTPTLVLHCRGDSVIPFEEGRYLAASIPGARFESLDSQNHVPLSGEPAFERLFELVREFVPGTQVTR